MGLPALTPPPLDGSSDYGRADSLRYNVMTYVVEQNYELAIADLKKFYNAKSDYPKFKPRIKRYIDHSVDLIHAIKAKRNFPGIKSLTMAKQQELNEKVRDHFDELQRTLKKIEKIQNELRIEDVRSTVWVVRAVMQAVAIILVIALSIEISNGLFKTFYLVVDDLMAQFANWLFELF